MLYSYIHPRLGVYISLYSVAHTPNGAFYEPPVVVVAAVVVVVVVVVVSRSVKI
jgi:hypothetical protein